MTTFGSTHTRLNFSAVAQALADHAEYVAVTFLGEPSRITQHEHRWGRRGSVSLRLTGTKRGLWCNHESGVGGNLLQLIARERNVRLPEAVVIAEQEFLGPSVIARPMTPRRRFTESDADHGAQARMVSALQKWSCSSSINGTLGEFYFAEHRKLDINRLDLSHVLRWHAASQAIIALMTDPATGNPTGIHRTFLNAIGSKIERKMLGRQGVVRLSPDDATTVGLGITEGIEDGLAVLLSGWRPIWAATSAGAICRFQLLPGIDALTIFADADEAGSQAAEVCRKHWLANGRDVHIAWPIEGRL